jgi:hypothetical protein
MRPQNPMRRGEANRCSAAQMFPTMFSALVFADARNVAAAGRLALISNRAPAASARERRPAMFRRQSDPHHGTVFQLRQGFLTHLEETKAHVQRLEPVFKMQGAEIKA